MGDNVVLQVDKLSKVASLQSVVSPTGYAHDEKVMEGNEEEVPLIKTVECRICQEDDDVKNLESPCACNGSLKFAHRHCVQRWIEEKRDLTCEICHQPYQPAYTLPPPSPGSLPDDTTIDISGRWMVAGAPAGLHDTRFLAMGATERRLLESDYDEFAGANGTAANLCRFAALILLALFLLRHALDNTGTGEDEPDDDITNIFSIFLLRALGFLLPCYIMAWAISILQQRQRQREEEARFASEVAFVLHSRDERGLQLTIVPGHTITNLETRQ